MGKLKEEVDVLREQVNYVVNEVQANGESSPKGFKAIMEGFYKDIKELKELTVQMRSWRELRKAFDKYWKSNPPVKALWIIFTHRKMLMLYLVLMAAYFGFLEKLLPLIFKHL